LLRASQSVHFLPFCWFIYDFCNLALCTLTCEVAVALCISKQKMHFVSWPILWYSTWFSILWLCELVGGVVFAVTRWFGYLFLPTGSSPKSTVCFSNETPTRCRGRKLYTVIMCFSFNVISCHGMKSIRWVSVRVLYMEYDSLRSITVHFHCGLDFVAVIPFHSSHFQGVSLSAFVRMWLQCVSVLVLWVDCPRRFVAVSNIGLFHCSFSLSTSNRRDTTIDCQPPLLLYLDSFAPLHSPGFDCICVLSSFSVLRPFYNALKVILQSHP